MTTYVITVEVDVPDGDDRNAPAIQLWVWNMIRTRPWDGAIFSIASTKRKRRRAA